MTPGFDLQAWLVGQLGQAPAALGSALRVARRDVDAGDRFGRGRDLRRGRDGKRRQLLGVRSLGSERMGAGFDHPARLLVQLGRVEAHHAGKRLAMGEAAVGLHQLLGMSRGDFDVIAEHRIVPDLQRADCGRIAVPRLERGNGSSAVRGRIAQRVEIRDHSPRRYSRPWKRRAAAKRPGLGRSLSTRSHARQASAAGVRAAAGDRASPSSSRLSASRGAEPVAQQGQIARATPARGQAREGAREIGHAPSAPMRTRSRRIASSWSQCDQRQSRSIARRSVSGAAMSSQSRRRPAAVWQRSISPSRLPGDASR